MGKFLVKATPSGWSFHLQAGSGEVLGTSEVYTSKYACRKGAVSVANTCVNAAVEDETVGARAKHPKFQVYQDKAGKFHFRLKAGNGGTILTSEAFSAKPACLNGVHSVVKNAPTAAIEDVVLQPA